MSPENFKVQQAIKFDFKATNNQAEYEALIAGLNLAKSLQVKNITVHSDSQLVIRQVKEDYVTKDETLGEYRKLVKSLLSSFPT